MTSITLRATIHVKRGDRDIVRTIGDKSTLASLYERIQNYTSFIIQFDDEQEQKALALTPHCQFIVGLERNFRQDYRGSARCLQSGSTMDDESNSGDAIKFKCSYWLAMVQNNYGQFERAAEAMAGVLLAPDLSQRRRIEATRLRWESQFFRCVNDSLAPDEAINGLKELDLQTAGDAREVRTAVKTTYGNVLLGAFLADPDNPESLADEASKQYRQVNEMYPAGRSPIWSDLGLALALTEIAGRSSALTPDIISLYTGVVDKSDSALQTRFEERAKLLLHSAKFISLKRLGMASATLARQAIANSIGRIDEQSYLFSQVSMTNVIRDKFIAEIDAV